MKITEEPLFNKCVFITHSQNTNQGSGDEILTPPRSTRFLGPPTNDITSQRHLKMNKSILKSIQKDMCSQWRDLGACVMWCLVPVPVRTLAAALWTCCKLVIEFSCSPDKSVEYNPAYKFLTIYSGENVMNLIVTETLTGGLETKLKNVMKNIQMEISLWTIPFWEVGDGKRSVIIKQWEVMISLP